MGRLFHIVNVLDKVVDCFDGLARAHLPLLADESVHFQRLVDTVKHLLSPLRHTVHILDHLDNACELVVLHLEVLVHHPVDEFGPLTEQVHQLPLHRLVKLAEVAFDQERVKLKLHARVRLVSVVL